MTGPPDRKIDLDSAILFVLIALLPLIFRAAPIAVLGTYFGTKVQLLEVAFAILFPVWIVAHLARRDLSLILPPKSIFFLGFAAVSLVSALFSADPRHALFDVAGFLYLFFLFFFFYHLLQDRRHVLLFLRWFLFVSLVIVLIGLAGYSLYRFFGVYNFAVEVYHGYLGMELVRPCSTFYTPNYYVIYLGFSAAVALVLMKIDHKRWVKGIALATLILIAITALTGFFRGSFVVWGVLFFGLGRFGRTRFTTALRGTVLVVFLLFAALFFLQGYMNLSPVKIYHDKAAERLSISLSTEESVYFNLHRTALRIFLDRPALGVGPGMYNAYMTRPEYGFDFKAYPWPKEAPLDPHSTYLGYAAETGIIGLFFLVLFFVGIISAFRRLSLASDPPGRELGSLFLVYMSLLMIYAVFIDIVTIRLLYFMYALGLSLLGETAAPEEGRPAKRR